MRSSLLLLLGLLLGRARGRSSADWLFGLGGIGGSSGTAEGWLAEMSKGLLVSLAGYNTLLGLLGLGNGLLNREVPAITLSIVGGLERVLVAVKLEGELVLGLLLEIRCLGLGSGQLMS